MTTIKNNARALKLNALNSLFTYPLGVLQGLTGAQGNTGLTGAPGPSGAANIDTLRGLMALRQFPSYLVDKKALIIDTVNGGFTYLDDNNAPVLYKLENASGIIVNNSTGGLTLSRKKVFSAAGANTLRYTHLADGTPAGILIEPALTYLNKYSQPNTAQLDSVLGVSNASTPSGETGNWLTVTSIGTTANAYQSVSVTSGDVVHIRQEIIMADGSAPVVGQNTSSGDLSLVFYGAIGSNSPDSGAADTRIEGPFLNNKYVISAYYTAGATGTGFFGWTKNSAQSSKNFYTGRRNIANGRWPVSGFDNANSSPNARSADVVSVPLTNFTGGGGMTIAGEFTPLGGATNNFIAHVGGGGTSRFDVNYTSTTLTVDYFDGASTYTNTVAGLTLGTKTKFAAAFDPSIGKMRVKAQAIIAPSDATIPTSISFTPNTFYIGSYTGSSNFLAGPVSILGVFDRAWTSTEIAVWVG